MVPPSLALRMFGEFEVWLAGVRVPERNFGRPKTAALLKLLLQERGRTFTAEALVDHLFPGRFPEKAIKNLHARISELRYALEPKLHRGIDSRFIERVGRGCYRFNPKIVVWLDTEVLQGRLVTARKQREHGCIGHAVSTLSHALALYRGPFLAHDAYEEWAIAVRDEWTSRCENALIELAGLHRELGQFQQAVTCCDRAIELNPSREAAYREKMRGLLSLGLQQEAVCVYNACHQALQDLGVLPMEDTVRIYQSIHQNSPTFANRRSTNSRSRERLLKGRFFLSRQTIGAMYKALNCFQDALSNDEQSADAHAGVADAHSQLATYFQMPFVQHHNIASVEAQRALALDDESAAGHAALAWVLMNFEWRGDKAESLLRRALVLDPAYLPAYVRLASLLSVCGRFGEAVSLVRQAREIDPLSLAVYITTARIYHLMQDVDGVLEACAHALELDQYACRAHHFLGLAHGERGNLNRSLRHLQRASSLSGGMTGDLTALGHAFGLAGRRADAEVVLAKLRASVQRQVVSPYHLALVFAGMNEPRIAVRHLERARQERSWPLVFVKAEPRLARLRATSTYRAWAADSLCCL